MQSLPMDPVGLTKSILSEIKSHVESRQELVRRGEFTRWTSDVKDWLDQKGRELGYYSIYTDDLGTSEFMLDIVWWKRGSGGSAALACEIEWGNTRDPRRNAGRVAEDFDKLLSFKAPLKLMIFSSEKNLKMRQDTIRELDRYLAEYGDHRVGEKYLVLDMTTKQAAWLCEVTEEGLGTGLRLERIDLLN